MSLSTLYLSLRCSSTARYHGVQFFRIVDFLALVEDVVEAGMILKDVCVAFASHVLVNFCLLEVELASQRLSEA